MNLLYRMMHQRKKNSHYEWLIVSKLLNVTDGWKTGEVEPRGPQIRLKIISEIAKKTGAEKEFKTTKEECIGLMSDDDNIEWFLLLISIFKNFLGINAQFSWQFWGFILKKNKTCDVITRHCRAIPPFDIPYKIITETFVKFSENNPTMFTSFKIPHLSVITWSLVRPLQPSAI